MNKILICSYYFYPENAPRAFRTFELAKEFSKRGYLVEVVIPDMNYDYTGLENKFGFKIYTIHSGFALNKNAKFPSQQLQNAKNQQTFFGSIFAWIFRCFYIGGRSFEFSFMLAKFLNKKKDHYKLIISIGLPISVHLGVYSYLKNDKHCTAIADYGDPFSFNISLDTKFYFKYIEKFILKKFDYISIPTQSAIDKFIYFKNADCIKIIPQGFDFCEIKLAKYVKNSVPTFAYAGIFYEKIRNPKIFFDYLVKLDMDFVFVIYTDKHNLLNMQLIEPYIHKLGNKLIINDLVKRVDCVYELSKMDFLINQGNINEDQKPSKLIDYALAKRPIFSFLQNNFDSDLFLLYFFNKIKHKPIDISYYDIKNVVNSYENLIKKGENV